MAARICQGWKIPCAQERKWLGQVTKLGLHSKGKPWRQSNEITDKTRGFMCGERKANVKEQTNKRIIQSKLRLEMRIPEHKIKSQSQIRDGQDVLDKVSGVKAEAIQSNGPDTDAQSSFIFHVLGRSRTF